MTWEDFIDMLKRHEGFRDRVYRDTRGVLTCGWGHALHEGSTVPKGACELFFFEDLVAVNEAYDGLGFPAYIDAMDTVREYVIKDMLFNLGPVNLMEFKKMVAAVRARDYETAAKEMLDSQWARQVKGRAVELAEMMRTGIYRGKSFRRAKEMG